MKTKYINYLILFIVLVCVFTYNNLSATRKKVKSDTINVHFDKLDNSFYINNLQTVGGRRERFLIQDNTILQDCTDIDEVKFKLCPDKSNNCLENSFKRKLKHNVEIPNGLYRLKIQTTDRYPIIHNNFYIRKLPKE